MDSQYMFFYFLVLIKLKLKPNLSLLTRRRVIATRFPAITYECESPKTWFHGDSDSTAKWFSDPDSPSETFF